MGTGVPSHRGLPCCRARQTCSRLGLEGVSTHSFRRSLAQSAMGRGVPLHVVQKLTDHKSLGSFGEYLSTSDEEVLAAITGERTAEEVKLPR
ncbi:MULTISPECIES: tyrosine-type recombinase/integrase [Synechococcales]|uniref:tyrosine-type recombinase/integrase n=1 Tax=Synechococcus sp. CS-1333 TaxID=2848638 RepID=UPI00223B2C30|nr:tyrosine-type recombinase/integrase [Synechococcus sp. CS-1333]MCT0209796.1 tyrosine-type recombinase/integrase [Synechococcus sp. CS-1333]